MDDTTLAMILATVQDTNARVRRMEQAVIEDAKERARWNRVQTAIAATLDPTLATEMEPVENGRAQTGQTPLPGLETPTGAKDSSTGAFPDDRVGGIDEHGVHWSGPRSQVPPGVTVTGPPQETASPDTIRHREDIDPDELDWFVGHDGRYYVHNDNGTDRRTTPAEQRAIDGQVGSGRKGRRR